MELEQRVSFLEQRVDTLTNALEMQIIVNKQNQEFTDTVIESLKKDHAQLVEIKKLIEELED